ncbi:hypothetical protein E4U21_002367 [Claviceps maximensis]|nr:hypothetical protein E4U21_002367 [Claviceps maximensis]
MQSNTSARNAHLDAFLASLSPWDMLYLRTEFRKGNIKISGLATLPDLPAEILSMVATKLEPEDIHHCQIVSRSWHAAWTHGAVLAPICHHLFPGLLEKAAIDQDPRSTAELFQSCIARQLWHKRGPYSKPSSIEWKRTSSAATPTSQQSRLGGGSEPWKEFAYTDVFYEGGLLAWEEGSTGAIVHDLRTDQRRQCNLINFWMNGETFRLTGMSSSLLVFTVGTFLSAGPTADTGVDTMRIWHVQSQTSKRVALPGSFAICFVEGEQVAILTRQGSIIKWSWSGIAIELDQSDSRNLTPEGYEAGMFLPGVILHPQKPNVTYLARIYQSKVLDPGSHKRTFLKRTFLMSVVRYDDAVPTNRWLETIQRESLGDDFYGSENRYLNLLCPKMSGHGLYSIGTISDRKYQRAFDFATTGFSIFKEAFIQRPCQYTEDDGALQPLRMFFPKSCYYNMTADLTTWSEAHPMIPRSFYLTVQTNNKIDTGPRDASKACRIFGDDEFRVYLSSYGIQAWSFVTDAQQPVENKLACERLFSDPMKFNNGFEPLAKQI